MHDALAHGLGESDRRGGHWGLGGLGIAGGDRSASLLDGGAERTAHGLIALGAHDALTVTFFCRRVIGHRLYSSILKRMRDLTRVASGLRLARVLRFGVVTLGVDRKFGRLATLVVGAVAARPDVPTTFSLPSRRNHQNTFKKGPVGLEGPGL